jgi:hypothetical protein
MPVRIAAVWEEAEEGVIDGIEICAVLVGVVEALGGDLWELAGSDEAGG